MSKLIPITTKDEIPIEYRDNPIGLLLEYHNLNKPFDNYQQACLLIGMCMDNRKHMHMPDNFAFIIRSGGANLRYSEFKVSFAIGVGGVKHLALIGHNNCGMVNLIGRRSEFIEGLVARAGWTKEEAEDHFFHFSSMYEIGSETDFILSEVKRLRLRYPKIQIAPMMYSVETGLLSLLDEN